MSGESVAEGFVWIRGKTNKALGTELFVAHFTFINCYFGQMRGQLIRLWSGDRQVIALKNLSYKLLLAEFLLRRFNLFSFRFLKQKIALAQKDDSSNLFARLRKSPRIPTSFRTAYSTPLSENYRHSVVESNHFTCRNAESLVTFLTWLVIPFNLSTIRLILELLLLHAHTIRTKFAFC